jgi:hypothetical protein
MSIVPTEYRNVKDSRQIGMERSNIRSTDLIDLDIHLVVLPNCESENRCSYWLGALNGINNRGCGINVLRFMSEIDENTAKQGLQTSLNSGPSVPGAFALFSDMLTWFNSKLASVKETNYTIVEYILDISSKDKLKKYFEVLKNNMPYNSCIIVKLNRDTTCANQKKLTPGHYQLISKWSNGDIYTYEPLLSTQNNCTKFKYKGDVSDNFFKTYQEQCYTSASLLAAKYIGPVPMDIEGGNKEQMNTKAFVMPDDTMDNLITDIKNSIECTNNIGGKLKSRKMPKKKTCKRNTCKRKTCKRKIYKRRSYKRKII